MRFTYDSISIIRKKRFNADETFNLSESFLFLSIMANTADPKKREIAARRVLDHLASYHHGLTPRVIDRKRIRNYYLTAWRDPTSSNKADYVKAALLQLKFQLGDEISLREFAHNYSEMLIASED